MLSAAQPSTVCPFVEESRPIIKVLGPTLLIAADSNKNSSSTDSSAYVAAAQQHGRLTQPLWWLPAPCTSCKSQQGPKKAQWQTLLRQPAQTFSSSAGGDRPSFKTQIRELYKRVHPDRFQDHPEAQVR